MSSDDLDEIPVLEVLDETVCSTLNQIELNSANDSNVFLKLSCLQNFLSLIVRNVGFKEFCREMMLIMMKAVPSEAASFLEVDNNKEFFFFRAAAGRCSDSIQAFQIPVNQGIVGKVYESKIFKVFNNVEASEEHLKSIEQAVGFQTRNLLAVPIFIRGEVFGVFELINRVGMVEFSKDDIEMAIYLSEWMSKAVETRLIINFKNSDNLRKVAA